MNHFLNISWRLVCECRHGTDIECKRSCLRHGIYPVVTASFIYFPFQYHFYFTKVTPCLDRLHVVVPYCAVSIIDDRIQSDANKFYGICDVSGKHLIHLLLFLVVLPYQGVPGVIVHSLCFSYTERSPGLLSASSEK